MKKLLVLAALLSLTLFAQSKVAVGIDEQLGKTLPLELKFRTEAGDEVPLNSLINKPTVLAFVYFECPGICTPLMNSIAEIVDQSDLKPGVNYNIITISFDDKETPLLASNKKANYKKMIQRKDFIDESWRFLTGDSASIQTITNAAGFHFKKEGNNFVHAGVLIFVSKDGKITRYLIPNYTQTGEYRVLPFDFKMAIIETAEGKVMPTIANLLEFCYSYDPEGRTYVLNFTRIIGAGILLLCGVFIIVLVIKPKKKIGELNSKENEKV